MKKAGHLIFGLFVAIAFIFFIGWLGFDWFDMGFKSTLVIMGIIGLYSILPDIDHKSSYITHVFFGLGILGVLFGIFEMIFDVTYLNHMYILGISAVFLVVTYVSSNFLKHRGMIHTVQFGALSVLPLWFLFGNWAFCLLGYVVWHSHLLGDGFLFKIR